MCYQPDPETTRRVVTPIPDGHKVAGYCGTTHVETDTVWETMELLQAHVAAWRLPHDEDAEQGLASQRLFAATARMLARLTEASMAEWQREHDGDACTAHLAQLAGDRAEQEAHQRARGVPTEAGQSEGYDTGSIQGMLGAFHWLSQTLSAAGVDVQEALQAADPPPTPAT